MRQFVLLILAICLVSCGFHLRGQMPLSPPLKVIYLKTADPYGALARNLRLYLKLSGATLVDKPENAETILVILNERTTDRLLGISGTQETRQYSLVLTVTFEITNALGKMLVGPQVMTETRVLTIKAGQILAGSNEEHTLYQQMRQAIVYDIMSRLSSHFITEQLTKQPSTDETLSSEIEIAP